MVRFQGVGQPYTLKPHTIQLPFAWSPVCPRSTYKHTHTLTHPLTHAPTHLPAPSLTHSLTPRTQLR